MKTRLEDLIQKASVAQPPSTLSRSNWTPYLPIIRILMEERAHTLMAAVEWLVGQGEIPQKRRGMAYRALRQILARRDAKRLRQQVELQRQLQAAVPVRRVRAAASAVSPAPSASASPAAAPSPGLVGALAALADVAPVPVCSPASVTIQKEGASQEGLEPGARLRMRRSKESSPDAKVNPDLAPNAANTLTPAAAV